MSEVAKGDDFGPLPKALPLLPVRDMVVFPFMVVPLLVNRPVSRAAVEAAQAGDRYLFLSAQKDAGLDDPTPRDLHTVGTVGKLLRARAQPDGQWKILVQGLRRARIKRVLEEKPCLVVRPEELVDNVSTSVGPGQIEGLVRAVKDGLRRLDEVGKALPQDVMTVLLGLDEPGALADLVAANLGLKVTEAQTVLAAASDFERMNQVNEILARELEVVAWQQKIQSQAKEEMSRTQREYFLREQLKQIRHELGDFDDKHEEIEDLRRRLAAAELPAEAQKEADKQLRRLEGMNAESAESGVVRTYLDWMADLPWSNQSEDRIDLAKAQAILDADHFGLDQVKDRILEYLGVLKLKGDHKGPILCFVGPPGVGKTSLGRSIARAVGREFVRLSLGGVHDESEVRGHRRTYVGAMPGRIIGGLKQAGTRNPVFMLDELDKLGRDVRGDPAAALLEVLDPEQNSTFRDHYLNLPFDLSRVMWVATANVVDTIPPPLRDRMELIHLPGYDIREKVEIARRYLIPKQKRECGLEEDQLNFSVSAIEAMVDRYTREAGLRGLDRQLAAVARKVARRFAEGRKRAVRIRANDLERFLGPRRHDPERPDDADRVGLATGLAWTEAGGTILHVEATLMPGRPGLTLTGQLGTVMKESAQAALSCARSRGKDFGVDDGSLRDHEIHVHVPHGAIPKDGPSAGITMAAAIISLLTGLPLRRDLAMTGEITLRGRVLPVGGLRQKLLAAARAGIRAVIVPSANEPDLSEVPAALRNELEIHLVRDLDEVVRLALVGYPARAREPGVGTQKSPQVGLA
ncbi:MAG: endopeptidase La [Myxococcales bacterium]|nr:endopeptidase La [Myxococcales bacterium]MCB9645573.1 endopeptidase La [Deltaproteobacteria bacterium]